MAKDTRLIRVAHVLVHMAGHDGMASSKLIGRMLETNPVVVRRMMGLLRNAGLVQSVAGSRGGWRLGRDLGSITLLAIHRALLPASIFAIDGGSSMSACKVEQAANDAVGGALRTADQAFEVALGEVTLADIRARARI